MRVQVLADKYGGGYDDGSVCRADLGEGPRVMVEQETICFKFTTLPILYRTRTD